MKKTIGTTILATTLTLGLFAAETNVANNELTAESTNTEVLQNVENMKDEMESKKILFEKIGQFFVNAFSDMKESAKEQSKKSWEDAKMSPSERTKKMQAEREAKLKEAQERKAAAEERYEKAKKK